MVAKRLQAFVGITVALTALTATAAIAQDPALLVVRQDAGDDAFTSIGEALESIPRRPETSYLIEIQDSRTYEESVDIAVNTSEEVTLTLRAQSGQSPTVVAAKKKHAAITLSTGFVTVEGLTLQGGGRRPGLHISWADDNTIRNCVVRGSRDKQTPGIYVQGGQRNRIVDNVITDNQVGILIFAEASDNIVSHNLIYGNLVRGIWMYKKTARNRVLHNTLWRNGLEFHFGTDGGAGKQPRAGNQFRNNVVSAGSGGVCIAVTLRDGFPEETVFDYNDLHAGASGSVAVFNDRAFGDLDSWRSASGQDAHSLATDPLFVDAPADLHLQSTAGSYHDDNWTADGGHSPAIDAGDPASEFASESDPNGRRANLGAYGNTAEASRSRAALPQAQFNSAAQGGDGTGAVAVSIEVSHAGGRDGRARLQWSDSENGSYAPATLRGPATADSEDSGGQPDVNNANPYQVGSGGDTHIVTSAGSNTVAFAWNSAADAPSADGTRWLRLTANDDQVDQEPSALTSLTVDNVAPVGLDLLEGVAASSASITWGWTPVSAESHFAGYSLWYGTNESEVRDRTGSAAVWEADDDAALSEVATVTTTVTGLQRGTVYNAQIWARDRFGNESNAPATRFLSAGLDSVFHYVAASGARNGTPNDPSQPWNSIQRAVAAIPKNLTRVESHYVVQVQDGARYEERVAINATTSAEYSVTLRAAAGQSPTLVAPNGKIGIAIKSPYAVLSGMRLVASNKFAIDVVKADHVTIERCVITDGTHKNNGGGVRLNQSSHAALTDNRFTDNTIAVLCARDADGATLINNVIVGYERGMTFVGGNNPAGDGHVIRNTIFHNVALCYDVEKPLGHTFAKSDYNDLHPLDDGAVGRIGGATHASLAEWREATGLDGNSLSLDPLFVDVAAAPTGMDLHLMSQAGHWNGSGWVRDERTSPVIDGGDPGDDHSLEPQPNGNRINMGAYGGTVEASRSGERTVVVGGVPWGEYVMMGAPLIPVDGSPDAVLGDDFPGEGDEDPWGLWWRLVRWARGGEEYAYYKEDFGAEGNPPDFRPGRGYWLIQWWSLLNDDGSTEGDSVSVTGTPVPLTEEYVIPLEAPDEERGLNQLANPFLFPINWADAQIRDNGSGRIGSVAHAAEAGWIDGHAYLWDWENETYRPLSAEGGRIGRWRGFWLEQLKEDADLDLLLKPVAVRRSLAKVAAEPRPTALDWYVEFAVTAADDAGNTLARDLHNRVGAREDASRRDDAFDAVDLTSLASPHVYVFFPHDDPDDSFAYWPERPGRYTYDIRDPDWKEQVWSFIVETDLADTELEWSWTNRKGCRALFRWPWQMPKRARS